MDKQVFLPEETIISINNQLSDTISPIHGVSQSSSASPILFIFYVSDIPQPIAALKVNLSQLLMVLNVFGQTPVIRNINLRLL